MKNETDIRKDQAEDLRYLVEEIEDNKEMENDTSAILEEATEKREIDILNLPPRRDVHITNNRTRLRISKPFFRITIVVIILILILIVSYYFIDNFDSIPF
ncbi:hypothetical protein [Oceanobacillus chungangensis]|uniref:Uncharacterized protein n=1 Tax=Oceanobacillus chungangensis TaxID=1229152 RepID=A0A3D8Q170_9BACI|nr:hypothetical protein [Oceanobacillus chungangensis]RDW22024.1 hypothetical protein CWR45_00605 [Oceanobacillus chungangensis]